MPTKDGKKSGGMQKGYRYYTLICTECGAEVAANVYTRHVASGCKKYLPRKRGKREQKTA